MAASREGTPTRLPGSPASKYPLADRRYREPVTWTPILRSTGSRGAAERENDRYAVPRARVRGREIRRTAVYLYSVRLMDVMARVVNFPAIRFAASAPAEP